jgi:hypothetical protein
LPAMPEPFAALARQVAGEITDVADYSWERDSSAVWRLTGASESKASRVYAGQRAIRTASVAVRAIWRARDPWRARTHSGRRRPEILPPNA